jgi:DNA-binding GntR family transcriptional regulator
MSVGAADRIGYRDVALEGIIDLAARGELPLEEKISEAQIAEQLEISRTPIREALAIYAGQGVVMQVPQTGTFIKRISAPMVAEAIQLRYWMEKVVVARLTAEGSNYEMRHLRFLGALMPTFNNKGTYGALKTDGQLHAAIMSDADSRLGQYSAMASIRQRLFHAEQPLADSDIATMLKADAQLASDLVQAPDKAAGQSALAANYAMQRALLSDA